MLLIVGLFVARQVSTGSGDIPGVETHGNLSQGHQDGPLSYPQSRLLAESTMGHG